MMKKCCKKARSEDRSCKCDGNCASEQKKRPDIETRIYNALNTAEKIAVKLAQINQILKKSKKKKNKKLGKVDKRTGTLILKGQKKQKNAKALKRHKNKK